MVKEGEGKDKLRIEMEKLMDTDKSSPEQILFLTVILQALLDATKPEQKQESLESRLARDSAKAWFTASIGVTAEDFGIVCDLAGINSEYTKSFAYKVIKSKEIEYVRKRINTVLSFK
tara:strand:- start:812 stop:1165 length:354 start_codon:yes stop_codon:yes gene_type:complete